jgi:hypothetical protein
MNVVETSRNVKIIMSFPKVNENSLHNSQVN